MMFMLRTASAAIVMLSAAAVERGNDGAFLSGSRAHAQAIVTLFPSQPVPEGYDTQTLFLICNFDWLRNERQEDLSALYAHFELFGRAIGANNAAVWFWKESPNLDAGLAHAVDIERSSELCGESGLPASESPYLVVTSKWDQDHIVFGLGELDAVGIKNVLVALSDKLIARDINLQDVQDRLWWESWYSAARSVLATTGVIARPLTVSIDTKFFSVEFDGSRLPPQ